MTEPSEMIAWLDRRIASAMTWLDDHGKGSKKPRPDHEIETKEYDIARFEEIKAAYVKALERRGQAA
ncbi:hypothetical protein [Rhizobium leguminosarum]|jgi:hypothetical protein|uniref:Uncharacterized protein n=1 Tax=Rhizobium leguminosarum bv. viciae TaxID=387 RepID=A0A7G6RH21_RHILV|nr:hypothetical protein [Rhizobium leguminosarum]ASS57604.1 hypothetical protein CHR56_25310 [Rhizobium leguminosarum bv. viciae]ASS60520.1 hypothetical protein CHR56_39050 [Rhizobium leguminosarum bv. viciae]QND41553.1 hypothetical protein HB770_10975 [Rhizobium leguminosarum bv. viciae]TBY17473.1 hypothetical protein E0H30_25980 [Rhizobium leguminosarum bv. viciae]TBY24637.1 hypothetical protein E0H37_23240 [Rhizobium leguminosarum bv. viciae]